MKNKKYEEQKLQFNSKIKELVKELKKHVSTQNGDWKVKGFIDVDKNIYTISSDTKIISKIIELHLFPLLLDFAEKNNYKIVLPEHQNYYPDITFVDCYNDEIKFALDIKTTFRRNDTTAGFTLGSHGGYFKERDKQKNIQFPYSEYSGHFCLGVIYSKNEIIERDSQTKVISINSQPFDKLKSITSVIKNFDFFVAEKWKIASDQQGSGNTANIGSIKDIDDLKNENGVFSKLGEEHFDDYWINYGDITKKDGKDIKITNILDYLEVRNLKYLIPLVNIKGAKRKKE